MKIKEIFPKLYHIEFKSQYIMAMSFLRVQEYYESSFKEIKGRYFLLEDYMDAYAEWKGNFTYCSDWTGFNIPGNIYVEWAQLFWQFPDMSQKEIELYNRILPIINKNGENFYLISSLDENTTLHEIAHGFYYLNSKYKKAMNKLINPRTKFYKNFHKKLSKMGYAKEVIRDEIQAYSATESIENLIKDGYIKRGDKTPVDKIKNIFEKYKRKI